MKKFLGFILFIGLFFAPLSGFAISEKGAIEENAVLELNDCIQYALDNSHRIKQFEGYLKVSKSRVGQARSDYFPTISAGTGYGYSGDYPSRGLSTSNGSYLASTSLNQLIYNFGKTGAIINMQKFYVIASKADLDNVILQTIFDVRTNYYSVLAAKVNIDIQRAYIQINERQYQRTKAYFEEGLKSKIDLVNAEVYLSEARIKLLEAQNDYDSAIIKLNNSMFNVDSPNYKIQGTETFNFRTNTIPVALKMISTNDTYTLPQMEKGAVYSTSVEKSDIIQDHIIKQFPYDFTQSVQIAKENRPDLKSLKATYSAMEQALKYAKREYMPEVSASAGYNFRDVSSTGYNNGFNAGAYLDFPIVNGMKTKYKIDEAKANLGIILNEIDTISEDIYFEVQKAYVNMKKLEKQVPLQQVKVRQTLENFELADGRYEIGLANFIELQDAKVNYNNAQQAYVKTVYDYNVAIANLELSMAMIPNEIKKTEEIK